MNEGDPVTLTGSFIDPNGDDTYTYSWTATDPHGNVVAVGDGPCFTFTPGDAGTYTVTYIVSDQNHGSGTAQALVISNSVQPGLTAPAATQNPVENVATSFDLGSLDVAGLGPFSVTVQWGDGQSSTFSPTGPGELFYSHAYSAQGPYKISETVTNTFDVTSASTSFTVDVIAEPVSLTAIPVSATIGSPTGSVVVATFTDPEGAEPVANYTASISWGDPSVSTGTVSYNSTTVSSPFMAALLRPDGNRTDHGHDQPRRRPAGVGNILGHGLASRFLDHGGRAG